MKVFAESFFPKGIGYSGEDLYSSSSDWIPYPLKIAAIFLA
jgi:hypothetical protein